MSSERPPPPDWLPDGWYSDYPDTPRFKYGGTHTRMIYDRNHQEEEGEGSGPTPEQGTPDLFNQPAENR